MPRRFRRKYWGLPNCADQEYAERAYEFFILNSKFLIPSGPLALLRRGLFGGDRLGGPLLPALTVSRLFLSASIRFTTFGGALGAAAETISSPAIFASMIFCSPSRYSSR